MPRTLEFFYFIGSTYSYLAVSRAEAYAAEQGVTLAWRPFSVRTLMREQENVPFANKPVKMKYMWRDLARRAQRFGVPFAGIPPYPIDREERANHMATLAAREGWVREFTREAYRTWFLDGRDPGGAEALPAILRTIGQDPAACLARAEQEDTLRAYAAATDRARQLGLFGSPTFVAGEEIFWGDDRLEDAVAWCLAH